MTDGASVRHTLSYRLMVYGIGLGVLSALWATVRLPMQEFNEFRAEGYIDLLPEVQAGFTLVYDVYTWLPLFILGALSVYVLWGAILSDRRNI
mgnify:CR=1 FL=1